MNDNDINILNIESDAIYVCGDIHGLFTTISNTIRHHDLHDAVIICCGDIGLGFYKEESDINDLSRLEKKIKENNVHVVFFRGNHDNPSIFNDTTSDKYKKYHKFKHINIIPDYTVLSITNINDKTIRHILCIGGAISIDRTYRLSQELSWLHEYMKWHNCDMDTAKQNCPRKAYFPTEMPVYDYDKLQFIVSNDEYHIDAICTHTAPSFCQPLTKNNIASWLMRDEQLEDDLTYERGVMNSIYQTFRENDKAPKYWCYGHFHFHHTEHIDNTSFYLMDMAHEYNNLLDIRELKF